jgi:hypothetical protein
MFLVLIACTYNFEFHITKAENITRFRLGASVPSSAIRGFGRRHGVSVDYSYQGGVNFYNYMTKGPGYFSAIAITTGLPGGDWPGFKNFLRGLLDSADADNGRCEIIFSLQGADFGWKFAWKPSLVEFLEGIGANRKSLRYIFLGGEWSYKNRQLPNDYDKLYAEWSEIRSLVQSYGYDLAVPDGKHISLFSQDVRKRIWQWGVRCRAGQLSRNPDISSTTLKQCYDTANWLENPTDVFLECFTMWDTAANIPGTPPYYIYYEKFDAFLRGAADRFDATNGAYPQVVTFEVMPETFNDVEGVGCPYLEWWFGDGKLADTYNLRTSKTEPVIPVPRGPDVPVPPPPFPPYPTTIFWVNSAGNLPPFYVQRGGNFSGAVRAALLGTGGALGNRVVEIHLVKQTIKQGDFCYYDHPITHEEYANKVQVGTITTKSDGWGRGTFTAPLEPGRYTVIARVPPTDTEMEGVSSFMEYILVADKVHRVEVRTNVKARLNFGPSAYGPPWHNCDPERWVEPSKPVVGTCSEGEWKFIMPSQVTDSQGKTWFFSHWEDGSTNPMRTILVDKDLVLEARYSEPGTGDTRMPSSISCSISSSELFKGDTTVISGLISPPVDGVFVTLTYVKPDGTSVTHSVTTSSSGSYSDNYTPETLGTYYVQAGWPGDSNYKGSVSTWISFSVIRRPSSISISVSSAYIVPGDSLGVSGILSPAVSNATVTLSYRVQGGCWITLTDLAVDSNGRFSYLWTDTPATKGTYELKASWLGNDDYEGISGSTSFSVVEATKSLEPDFSVSIDKPYLVLVIGESEQDITVVLRSRQGLCSDVGLSLSNMPKGVVANLLPRTVALPSDGSASSTIKIRASWVSSPGSYVLHLVASGGGKEHSAEIKLKVVLPTPRFTVSINPPAIKIPTLGGYNATVAIEVSSLSNYTIEPSLSFSGVPDEVEICLDKDVLSIPRMASGLANLTIRTGAKPPAQGNYSVLVECSYQGVVAKEKITLVIVDRVPMVLRADLNPKSVKYGDCVLVEGSLSPQRPAEILITVALENGTEVKMATLKTNASGGFSHSMPILLPEGEYEVKVSCEGDAFYYGTGLNFTLRVERADVVITLLSNITKVETDKPVLLEGGVKTANGKPLQNLDVTILISGKTGLQSITTKTDENGTYAVVVSGLSPGEYNVTSLVDDSNLHKAAKSEVLKLEVYNLVLPQPSDNLMSVITGIALTNLALAIVSIARRSVKRS